MEPTQAKLVKKRRRRWLIFAFVLLLVSLFSWWYWPRGDARFVGKWTVYETQGPRSGFTQWIFHPNGILETRIRTGSANKTTWRVEDDLLLTGHYWNSSPLDRFVPISDWWGRVADPFLADSERSRIEVELISTTDLHISFQSIEGRRAGLKLTRIHE